jgi:ATP-dependent exoDNAse (exonuclease V) alpha subunit
VLFKPDRPNGLALSQLEPGVVPVVPWKTRRPFKITINNERRSVSRLQVPMLPAYALTIEKCQGQNVPLSLLDICSVPSGFQMSPAHLYVAFSRSPGRDSIRILRRFNNKVKDLLQMHVSEELRDDDRLLISQAKETKIKFLAGSLFTL